MAWRPVSCFKAQERRYAASEGVRVELTKSALTVHVTVIKDVEGEFNELAHLLQRAERSPARFDPDLLIEQAESLRKLVRKNIGVLGEPAVSRCTV